MFLAGSVYDKLENRIEALEENDYSSLESRISENEGDISALKSRATSLETWRGNKYSAIANETNMTVSTSIGTAVITLGLNAPTAASIETNFNAVKTEINNVKAKVNTVLSALREREIIAT